MKKTFSMILIVSLVLVLALSCSPEQSAPGSEAVLPSPEEVKKPNETELANLESVFNIAQADLMEYIGTGENLPNLINELASEIQIRSGNVTIEFKDSTTTVKTTNNSLGFEYISVEKVNGDRSTEETTTIVKDRVTYVIKVESELFSDTGTITSVSKNGTEITAENERKEILINIYTDCSNKVSIDFLTTMNKGQISLLGGKLVIDVDANEETRTIDATVMINNLEINGSTYSAVANINANESAGKTTIKASGTTSGNIGTHSVAADISMTGDKNIIKLYIDNFIYLDKEITTRT